MSESNTTRVIRRRIRHWKTTLTGIGLLFSPIISAIWPDAAPVVDKVTGVLIGAGFVSAADGARVRDTEPAP